MRVIMLKKRENCQCHSVFKRFALERTNLVVSQPVLEYLPFKSEEFQRTFCCLIVQHNNKSLPQLFKIPQCSLHLFYLYLKADILGSKVLAVPFRQVLFPRQYLIHTVLSNRGHLSFYFSV